MLEFVCRFTTIGFAPVSLAHACLRVPLRTKKPLCPVSDALIASSKQVLQRLQSPISTRNSSGAESMGYAFRNAWIHFGCTRVGA